MKRILAFDLVRVFAILGVVLIHTESITTSTTNYLGGLSWWFANTIHSAVSVSVPLFILLTGALILHKPKLTYAYIWLKVLGQFLLPLVLWWLFYSWWNASRSGLPLDFALLAQRFFLTDVGHLYFLQICIGLYLVMPLVHRFLKKTAPKKQYRVLALITSLSVLYEYLSFMVLKTYNTTTIFFIFLPFLTYVLWGYFLAKVVVTPKQWWLLAILAASLTGLVSVTTYINTLAFNRGSTLFWSPAGGNLFWEPFTVPIFLLSLLSFVLLINLPKVFPKLFVTRIVVRSVEIIALASFGVYLLHPWVIEQIDHFFNLSIQFITYPLWLYYLQRTLYVFLTALVITLIVLKLPYLKTLFGMTKASQIKNT